MDKDYADEMYRQKHTTPQYFDNTYFEDFPWCAGCNQRELDVRDSKFLSGNVVLSVSSTVYCRNARLCLSLWRHISEQQG